MTVYAQPGQAGAVADFKPRYDHYIGGQYVAPSSGQYFENVTPVTGRVFCEIARGNAEDIDKALDAAHAAAKTLEHHFTNRARNHSEQDCGPHGSKS